jgi:hypothetical protein
MNFLENPSNKNKKEWHALGITDAYDPDDPQEETYDNMRVNDDLCGLIHDYYQETGDDSVKFIVKEDRLDRDGRWIFADGTPQKKPRAKAKQKTKSTKNPSSKASARTASPFTEAARGAASAAAKGPPSAVAAAAKRPPAAASGQKRPPPSGRPAVAPAKAAKRPAPSKDDRRSSPRKRKK